MKEKGFTLIELLAVIVILAIIALIATPIILNIISDAKKESEDRSVENYLSGVTNAITKENLTREFNPSTCIVQTNGNIKCDNEETEVKVETEGTRPSSGTIKINNGKIENYINLLVNGEEKSKYKTYENGEVVYFDVGAGRTCTTYTESQSNTGVKTGCMKFYAFNDEGGETLNLLLDHNTTATIAWNSSVSNETGPKEVINQLKTDTEGWIGTIEPSNYEYKGSARPYTIDYTGYKARLITANEVAQITGNTSWNETTSTNLYYFDTLTQTESTTCKSGDTSGCKYGWLYDRTNTGCTTYGCLNNSNVFTFGYWTSSAHASHSWDAWRVYSGGGAFELTVSSGGDYGVRPVITISKSQI